MNWLTQFKVLAIAEGISYLLFGLTMPLKYVYEVPEPNYFVGMAHGVLFILYCVWAVVVAKSIVGVLFEQAQFLQLLCFQSLHS